MKGKGFVNVFFGVFYIGGENEQISSPAARSLPKLHHSALYHLPKPAIVVSF